ncbi:chaperonin 10-like protein [Phialemonium atrogriseum]|uniref:Chaperonin 10-like protein n=1 Tax=Phialemonium atrogriseum TaxID=1093897 RepID=A0AAJ0BP24_9PEZI|nr:chaperonin 10-like protein [Phialemonium atrogriseum]KAK1761855.1 chaperonin 10-like protein [Phialemonium atrogriseum]
MRAQVLEAFNTPYVLKDVPKPAAPTGHDILVQVQAASYCHTDAVFASGAMWQDLPRVGSHEFAGIIVSMGPNVSKDLGLAVGRAVGVPGRAFHSCGTCYECRNNDGDPESYGVYCVKAGNLGLSRDGGFQEFCIVDSRQVAPIPAGMTAVDTAPLMCAGLTIWNALGTGRVGLRKGGGDGLTVAISGAGGGLGHLGVQFAARLGCNVVAIDAGDAALKLLHEVVQGLGSLSSKVTIVDARTQKAEDVRRAVSGQPEPGLEGEKGVDALLVLPEAQQALEYGMKLIKDHGICVLVSFPKEGFLIQPRDLVFRHIQMTGVLVGRNHQLRAMLNFAAQEGVRARTRTYSLEQLNQLVDDYHDGASGKLVVDMTQ